MSEIRWRGIPAVYTESEKRIVRLLTVREQFLVHLLKAVGSGEVSNPLEIQGVKPPATAGSLAPSGQQLDRVPRPVTPGGLTTFIDAEDIPFGEEPRKRYKPSEVNVVVAWTWNKYRVVKTKKRANEVMRVWKRWYERQGWKVQRIGDDYLAVKDNERHAITLRVYPKT